MLLKQLSWYLLVPKPTLYRQVREGKVPGKKVGRQWRFLKTPIDKWLGSAANWAGLRAIYGRVRSN